MSIAIAQRLAAEHPKAKLPCPICVGSVNGENLATHLTKVHPEAVELPSPWRGRGVLGIFPCSVTLVGNELALRHTLGLFRRVVSLPASLEFGSLWRQQANAILEHAPATDVRAGRYLRVQCPRSRVGMTIGCRGGVRLSEHWDGATQGPRKSSVSVVVSREAMVALEYGLAERGLLAPHVA